MDEVETVVASPVLTEKYCKTCKVVKPIGEFGRGNTSHDKYRHSCKLCVAAIRRSKKPIYPEGKRRCGKCGIVKDLEADFSKNKAYYTGYYYQCKACNSVYMKARRKANPEQMRIFDRRSYRKRVVDVREHARLHRNEYHAINKAYVDTVKALGCVDCGETHPACLDLDHIDSRGREALYGIPSNVDFIAQVGQGRGGKV